MYLLDTVILSELRREPRDTGVVAWISAQRPTDLYISAFTIGEIERGIARQRRKNPPFAESLAGWLDSLLTLYAERILPVDTATARRWGQLSAAVGNDSVDLVIAATALEHGLTVVTRNTRHFEPTGALILNPFSGQG